MELWLPSDPAALAPALNVETLLQVDRAMTKPQNCFFVPVLLHKTAYAAQAGSRQAKVTWKSTLSVSNKVKDQPHWLNLTAADEQLH